jgi:hypothetical protein
VTLSAQLSIQLDAGQLIEQLLAALSGPGGPAHDLAAIAPPAGASEIGAATSGAGAVDTSGIGAVVSQVAQQVPALLASFPATGTVLGPLAASLDLVDQIGTHDLGAQIRSLGDRLTAELHGSREGGFIAVLLRIADVLSTAPEGRALMDLLQALLRAGGKDLPTGVLSAGNVLPAIDGTVKVVGGLMALESVLSEADRLTGLMARQLDPATVQPAIDAVEAAFGVAGAGGGPDLASFLAQLDPAQPAEVEAAVAALANGAARVAALRDLLAGGMGFGEATLVYLDVDQVQSELATGVAMVRAADLDAVERAARSLAGLAAPLLKLDLANFPAFDLPGLLAAVEGKVEDFAAKIRAFDTAAVAAPLTEGLGTVTGAIRGLADVIERVSAAIKGALEQVRQAVAALPVGAIANTIQAVLQPITAVLDALRQLIAGIETALHTAVQVATQALGGIESAVDDLKHQVEAFFGEAKKFIDGLHLDQVLGEVTNAIDAFADVLAKARMGPYFDAAAGAIDGAADVIGAVPFGLLPDDMKAQVETAVQPIRDADAKAIQVEIESLLDIQNGKLKLREDLAPAIAEVQAEYEALLETVRGHDPRKLLQTIDGELAQVAAKIHDLTPSLTLQPVQQAIDRVKATVAGFDLRRELAPIDAAFAQILAALDRFSPDQLIAPLDEKVKSAKQKLVGAIGLAGWKPAVDGVVAQADALLARFDPVTLTPQLRAAIGEARALLDRFPDVSPAAGFGNLFALLLAGSGLRIYPWTFGVVTGWLGATSGASDLLDRAQRIADAVTHTREAVAAVDLTAIAGRLGTRVQAVRAALAGNAAINALAASEPVRLRLTGAVGGLDVSLSLSPLTVNRDRYLAALTQSATLAETLRRSGLSEVDAQLLRMRTAVVPLKAITDLPRAFATRIGLPGLDQGLVPALRELLDVATPERLTAIIMPLFVALRERADALIQAIVAPIKDGIAELERLVDEIDLGPLRHAIDAVFAEARQQVESLEPSRLLAAPLAAFDALKAEVAGFDPLKDVLAILKALQATIERVLGKLHAQEILATPLAIYDEILADLGRLDVPALLAPVFAALDGIAVEVDSGLTRTVEAFEKLQRSLPSGDGGALGAAAGALGALGAGTVSIDVSVGF